MSGLDRYADWDAAYVLGSLSGAERHEYEEHLARCPACRRAVAELAGMPGLLARVPAQEALALDTLDDEVLRAEPPASLMPVLPVVEGTSYRRRDWRVPAAAAAAALAIGGVGGYAVSAATGGGERPPVAVSSNGPTRLAFSPVIPSSMTAVVDLVPSGRGTQVQVECQYAATGPSPTSTSRPMGAKDYDPAWAWADYAVWVVDRHGKAVQGAVWTARPDKVMRPSAPSALAPRDIAAVEIRLVATGETVMRAANT
ncbi:Putative zinc-finger [Pedococcus cremeus]|uniref:Putative zinc-finger n=1 Tax=Pedococcus cremeus TaxID=587636 RepID=A0A1H9XIG7_9MICO|nr:zf-HC2 domain-containing protein [Pedococcus cremeus]SES45986.1 Putative zinc-finger [Pedococcus cremeus]